MKKAGGCGRAMFTESMHAVTLTTLELQTELRLAIERGNLRVHYQALMRAGDAGIAGFEALVRWEHLQRGLVLPSLFIPAAEEIDVWQFMRDNWLSNHVFRSYDAIVDHCCEAWAKLTDQPWLIMSICLRTWARRF